VRQMPFNRISQDGYRLLNWALMAACVVWGLSFWHGPYNIHGDTSWMIEVVGRMLAGQRAYVDFFETNPPMSLFLYVPPVWFARFFGISPEWCVYIYVGLIGALSLGLCASIIRRLRLLPQHSFVPVFVVMCLILFVLPTRVFTQREHIALMTLLPSLLLMAASALGHPAVPLWMRLLAGLGAGITVCIKPHFIFALIFPAFALAYMRHTLKPLFALEHVVSASVVLIYLIVFVYFYGAYFETMWPLLSVTYLPRTLELSVFLKLPTTWFAGFALFFFMILKRREIFRPDSALIFASALGFLLAYFIQRKGWPYHIYPFVALMMVLLIVPPFRFFDRDEMEGQSRSVPALLFSGLFCFGVFVFAYHPDVSGLKNKLAPIKQRPSLYIATHDLAVNFPLVRQLDARWVGRMGSNWVSMIGLRRLEEGKIDKEEEISRINASIRFDKQLIVEDISKNMPDILVYDSLFLDWHAWLQQEPLIREAMQHYVFYDRAEKDRFIIFVRR
jgi:hypothetical protein